METEAIRGTLILNPSQDKEVQKKIGSFLSRYVKNLAAGDIDKIIKKAPVVIGRDIPERAGRTVMIRLQELGGSATFVPAQGSEKTSAGSGGTPLVPKEPSSPVSHGQTEMAPLLSKKGNEYSLKAHSVIDRIAAVNKELWIVLSMLALIAVMNYLITSQTMLLGLYTIPTVISAYFYGRRHATLTAFASVFLVGLLLHLNPQVFKSQGSEALFVDSLWYEIVSWGGILVITAYAMGTLYERSARQLKELRETYHGLLVILRQFISKDQYTENHCYRVSIYGEKIAAYLGFNEEQIEDVRSAALLHDLGKLDVSRTLLYKAAQLTQEEYTDIKSHVEKGAQMLKPIGGPLRRILPIILAHHEHYDGTGYNAAHGDDIPLEGRVLAVADVYDSLVSDRPYRKAMSPFEAKEIIEKGTGTDFDPQVVKAFLKAFRRGEMEVPNVVV